MKGTEIRERGATLLECLVATAIGLALAAVIGHTLWTYQRAYQVRAAHIDRDQQPRIILDVVVEELHAAFRPAGPRQCPPGGVEVGEGRLAFATNLHDRMGRLADRTKAGETRLTLASSVDFEPGDWIRIADVADPSDPSDDVAECRRIVAVERSGLMVEQGLQRAYPSGSPIAAINRVTYRLDERRRLLRTQDGWVQRVAQHVERFDTERDGETVRLRMIMHDERSGPPKVWERRVEYD